MGSHGGQIPIDLHANSKVLAYHGPLIYEAKVMKCHLAGSKYVESVDEEVQLLEEVNLPPKTLDVDMYLLHYKGWKNKWDEWVAKDRIMEVNEHNIQLMKQLRLQKFESRKAKESKVAKVAKKSNGPPRTTIKEDAIKLKTKKGDVILPMPDRLKYLLVDDWEFVTKDHKVLSIPSKRPVRVILQDYLQYIKNRKTPEELSISREVVSGLMIYFDKSVKLIFLYKYERLQYGRLVAKKPDIDLCDYYGIEHLLRLFVSLPGLVAETTMDAPSIQTLMIECSDIMDFLDEKYNGYLNDYENTSAAYDGLARS